MAKLRTIVLCGRDDLLRSSVELFLKTQRGWRVITVPQEGKFDELIVAVGKLNPDVVILHQSERYEFSNLPMKLLQKHSEMKVIMMNPNDNFLQVYSKQNIMLKSASDLITVVEANMLSSNGQ